MKENPKVSPIDIEVPADFRFVLFFPKNHPEQFAIICGQTAEDLLHNSLSFIRNQSALRVGVGVGRIKTVVWKRIGLRLGAEPLQHHVVAHGIHECSESFGMFLRRPCSATSKALAGTFPGRCRR